MVQQERTNHRKLQLTQITMDFSSLPTHPMDTRRLYSPNNEAYLSPETPESYLADSYTQTPDYFQGYLIDDNSHCYSTAESLDAASSWGCPSPGMFPDTSSLVDMAPTANGIDMNAWLGFNSGDLAYGKTPFDVDTTKTYHSANSIHSCSSSSPASPAISPRITKQTHLTPPPNRPATFIHASLEPVKRKRGRPRLPPSAKTSASTPAHKVTRPQCVPHTEVERKYREKLNTELERLRQAVPSLIQADSNNAMGGARISKSVVLAVAINYIKELEVQRDLAVDEVRRLGGEMNFGTR